MSCVRYEFTRFASRIRLRAFLGIISSLSDHRETLRRSLHFLKEDGILVLAAEPVVIEPSEVVPCPWGPRLDGETLRAIRRFGWMELGFTETYLYELLSPFGNGSRLERRTGLTLSFCGVLGERLQR
jgi:hypothetical protein